MHRATLAMILLALATPDARPDPAGATITGRVVTVENGHPRPRDEVWVYVERPRRARRRATSDLPEREIRQEAEQFVPHTLVVPIGTNVFFPNYDKQEHNVFSPTSPPFDVGRYNTDRKGKARKLEDKGEVEIYCDIHKQMWARILVVDADPQLIVKAAADGSYTIANVPPGTYKVWAWRYASTPVATTVTVGADGSVKADDLNLQLGQMAEHRRKDGSPYPLVYREH